MDLAVRGGQRPADGLQVTEGRQELVPEHGVGLLGGAGLDLVVDAGGVGQGVEERSVVLLDQAVDGGRAEGVVVGLLVGVVCLGVEHDVVGGVVERAEADYRIDVEGALGGLGQQERGGLDQGGAEVRGAVDLGADAERDAFRPGCL